MFPILLEGKVDTPHLVSVDTYVLPCIKVVLKLLGLHSRFSVCGSFLFVCMHVCMYEHFDLRCVTCVDRFTTIL